MDGMWIVLTIIFLVIEVATAGAMVSIWFFVGALAAMLADYLGANVVVQFLVFFVVSLALLFLTKPFIKKYVRPVLSKTNADRIINEHGIVTEEINNLLGKGAVYVDGKHWTAKNIDGDKIISVDVEVEIIEIQGVKVLVKELNKQEE
ncbi:NfeD family protein [Eubacteriaceae bacterium ES3]|nr:NfeD family protein [Eubacteriaceae bacterium ES3]